MRVDTKVGELREWNPNVGRRGTFIVIGIDGYRVDVILSDGKRDGFLKPYLESNSHVISETKEKGSKGR